MVKAASTVLGKRNVGRIRMGRLERALRRYECREVEHNFGGARMRIWLTDPMSAAWYGTDCPSIPEIEVLSGSRLRPGARVFDLGAHQCVIAMVMANSVSPSGQVIAVEPSEHNCSAARRNIESNGFSNIVLVQAAAGANAGEAAFSERLNGQMDDGRGRVGTVKVPVTTVDALALHYGPPDVVFIDVEGFECDVLKGAMKVKATRPDFFVEVHGGGQLEGFGGSVREVTGFFDPDYRFLISTGDGLPFNEVSRSGPFPEDRFFLIALAATKREALGAMPLT
jgi:FkbM family methyltransferase